MALHEYYSQQRWENVWFTSFPPPSSLFPFFFPTRPESCLAHLSAKVVPSVCMLHKLCFSWKNPQVFKSHTSTKLGKVLLWGKKNNYSAVFSQHNFEILSSSFSNQKNHVHYSLLGHSQEKESLGNFKVLLNFICLTGVKCSWMVLDSKSSPMEFNMGMCWCFPVYGDFFTSSVSFILNDSHHIHKF